MIAIILGVIVLGGGAYFVMQSKQSPQTASENNLDTLPTTQTTTQAPTKTPAQQQEDETIIHVYMAENTSKEDATPVIQLLQGNDAVYSAAYVSADQMLKDYVKRHGGPPRDGSSTSDSNPFNGMILVHVKEPALRKEVAVFVKMQMWGSAPPGSSLSPIKDSVVSHVDW